jgi:hypothetical protein
MYIEDFISGDLPENFEQVIAIVNRFTEAYQYSEWHLAHIVLSDFNLTDGHIEYCQRECFNDVWLEKNKAKIDVREIIATWEFLEWLKTLPEDIREYPAEYLD